MQSCFLPRWILSQRFLQMLAEPIGKLGFVDLTASDTFHNLNRIQGIEVKTLAVVGQEQASNDPGGTFIAVDETVVLR